MCERMAESWGPKVAAWESVIARRAREAILRTSSGEMDIERGYVEFDPFRGVAGAFRTLNELMRGSRAGGSDSIRTRLVGCPNDALEEGGVLHFGIPGVS